MSPGPCRERPVDERSDLYSLGAIFHEMLGCMVEFSFKARLTFRQTVQLVVLVALVATGALRYFL